MTILGGGAFGKWLGHKGRVLTNGFSAFKKRIQSNSYTHIPCEDTVAMNQEKGPYQNVTIPVPWSWTCQPRTVRNKFLLINQPVCGILLQRPERLRHSLSFNCKIGIIQYSMGIITLRIKWSNMYYYAFTIHSLFT